MSFYKQGHISNFQGIISSMIFKQLKKWIPAKNKPRSQPQNKCSPLEVPLSQRAEGGNKIELKFVIY